MGLLEARRAEATPEAPPLDTAAAAALQNVNGVACVDVRGRTHARASPGQGCDIRGYFAGDNGACFRQIAHFYKGDGEWSEGGSFPLPALPRALEGHRG